jgi:solute carrier family 25 S-adenosylmethionine transporter 26
MAYSWRVDGPLGLFDKGKLSSQIFRDVPYAIVTLVTYEILQKAVVTALLREAQRRQAAAGNAKAKGQNERGNVVEAALAAVFGANKKLKDAMCGSLAGGFGGFATTPMDVIKTRMMTGTQSVTVLDAATRIARDEGLATFFVGAGPRLMQKVPANGLFFLLYEAFRSFLGVASTGAD